LKQRKGRDEHPKRNRQAIAVLLILSLFLIVFLSGCLEGEKTAEDEFFTHIETSRQLVQKSTPIHNKAVYEEENNTKAAELLVESKKLIEQAREEVILAKKSTNDPNKQKYAEYLIESLKYDIMYHEKLIEAQPYIARNDEETARKRVREGEEYLKQGKYWLDEATKIKPEK